VAGATGDTSGEERKIRAKIIREAVSGQARIVIKVGSSTLTHASGRLNLERMSALARELADLAAAGHRPLLVTSGAVAAGLGRLGRSARPAGLPERQAIAAVGQGLLMQTYAKFFGEHDRVVAQVLLTRDDASDRRRYLNARHTLLTLLALDVIPVINENDTVATEELQGQFGENDTLAAMVAGLVGADLLVLMTDVEGLFSADPRHDSSAERISLVKEITPEVAAQAGGAGSAAGRGGMRTKIEAARIATSSGCPMALIAHSPVGLLRRLLDGEDVGTLFQPRARSLQARDQWIAFGQVPAGEIVVDYGAVRALREGGKSLLPSGVTSVNGQFNQGDLVRVVDREGREVARGLVNYDHADAAKLAGHKTSEIEGLLGSKGYDEIIHRDNLVCL